MFRPTVKRKIQQDPSSSQIHLPAVPDGEGQFDRPPPSSFTLYAYSATGCSEESYNASVDDIRRPSGLGRAASFSSYRSMPASPSFPPPSQNHFEESDLGPEEDNTPRSRTVSSPNLLRSLSMKAKAKLRSKRASISSVFQLSPAKAAEVTLPSPNPPHPSVSAPKIPQLPGEVVEIVFSHVPREQIPKLASLSHAFAAAARGCLYRRIDLQKLTDKQLEKLLALLASRLDLTELVQHFSCTTWPSFFNAGRHSKAVPATASSPDREDQLRNTLLTATFTLALQRMTNLTHLTLPSFDIALLSQHTAFGLKSITFLNTTISSEEVTSLLTWLDGQINISTLAFPNLEDFFPSQPSTIPSDNSMVPNTPYATKTDTPTYYLHTPQASNTHQPNSSFTHNNPYLKVSPVSTPMSPSFHLSVPQAALSSTSLAAPSVLFDSSTLLPMVTTLHVTPALLAHLIPVAPSTSTISSSSPRQSLAGLARPFLRKVSLNVSTNLYDGLRPSAIMSCLKGINQLSMRFSESVDRRTVEKMLTAVSSALGSSSDEEPEPESKQSGLESLEVIFKTKATLSRGMEDMVYRTLQSTLSRYSGLRNLKLDFVSNQRGGKSLPLIPLDVAVANSKATTTPGTVLASPEPIQDDDFLKVEDSDPGNLNESFKFPAFPLPPASPSLLPFPVTQSNTLVFSRSTDQVSNLSRPSSARSSRVFFSNPSRQSSLSSSDRSMTGSPDRHTTQERAKIETWVSHCPSLRTVTLSGMTWYNPVWLPALKNT
ncbi:hypothetical protein CC1G_02689 [Coprinopsis cinerea okayama7|uniref:F-box domain-containing protein n=1 Tax=Coprinopsis cinerea (strain Okayama-7 / 130 / ATCC MYA-4618 / FGSC 9003) TaxID=240176 RepID=A8PBN3_COPC7|nr:hypothetical protein CC1G_02689 [Coprinopsis cinerea okayama7\|eukprot:XP_001840226.2 hypothetical protein CC1G_02689 [Coprinopsis cinerea okayama7\